MTHEPRTRTSLDGPAESTRPLHEVVDRWRARQAPHVEWCVCDGYIEALSDSNADVMDAVQRHQVDPVHIAHDVGHGIPLSEAQLLAMAVDGELVPAPIGGR